jgi:hypothetical protein
LVASPRVIEHNNVRIVIFAQGDAHGQGLVRRSWEIVSEVRPPECQRYEVAAHEDRAQRRHLPAAIVGQADQMRHHRRCEQRGESCDDVDRLARVDIGQQPVDLLRNRRFQRAHVARQKHFLHQRPQPRVIGRIEHGQHRGDVGAERMKLVLQLGRRLRIGGAVATLPHSANEMGRSHEVARCGVADNHGRSVGHTKMIAQRMEPRENRFGRAFGVLIRHQRLEQAPGLLLGIARSGHHNSSRHLWRRCPEGGYYVSTVGKIGLTVRDAGRARAHVPAGTA